MIWNLGVKIDPTGAQTGGRQVEAAAEKVEERLKRADKAALGLGAALQKLAQSAGLAARMANGFSGPGRSMTNILDSMSTASSRLWKSLVALPGALQAVGLAMLPFRAFKNVLGNAIGAFSEREIGLTRLAVLKRSFTEARKDFQELQKLSDITPYTSRELLGAYTTLTPFIKELGGMERALRLVGDAASGTQRDIEWITRWTARLYGSAKSGRALGEELEGLADLGVITQKTQSALLELGKANEKGRLFKEIWGLAEADMLRFTGMMELQSRLWSGKLSTLREKWETIQATFAEPIVDALKPVLDQMIQAASILVIKLKGQQDNIQDFAIRVIATIKVLANPSNYGQIWEAIKEGFAKAGDWMVNKASEIGAKIADAMMTKIQQGIEAGAKKLGTGALKAMPSPWVIPWGMLPMPKVSQGFINSSFATVGAPSTALTGRAYAQQMPAGDGSISGSLFGSGQTPPAGTYDRALIPGTGNPSLAEAWLGTGSVNKTATESLADKIEDEYRALKSVIESNKLTDSDLPKNKSTGEELRAAEKLLETENALGKAAKDRNQTQEEMANAYVTFLEQYGSRAEKMALMEHELQELYEKRVITLGQMQSAMAQLHAQHTETGQLMMEWADMAKQMDRSVAGILESVAGGMGNALTDIMSQTKSTSDAFSEMGLSIINDINNIISRMLVQWAIQKLVGLVAGPTGEAIVGGIYGATNASVYHDGTGQTKRTLPSAIFASAPRYHNGLAPGEVPAVIEKDEAILTRNQQAAIKAKLGEQSAPAGESQRPIMIVNAQNRDEIAAIMASRPDVVLNILRQNAGTVRRLVNVGKV